MITDMVGTTEKTPTCPSDKYTANLVNPHYNSFVQCLSATNRVVDPTSYRPVESVAECHAKCEALGTTYASLKASTNNCMCFNSFSGSPTNCGAGNDYVWGVGGGPSPSGKPNPKRRSDSPSNCPAPASACLVAPTLRLVQQPANILIATPKDEDDNEEHNNQYHKRGGLLFKRTGSGSSPSDPGFECLTTQTDPGECERTVVL